MPDIELRECAEELMGRARCPAATRPAESEGDYVRRMFRELHRRLVLPPEHGADSIDAAIGYALNDCEAAVMDALAASNTPRDEASHVR